MTDTEHTFTEALKALMAASPLPPGDLLTITVGTAMLHAIPAIGPAAATNAVLDLAERTVRLASRTGAGGPTAAAPRGGPLN